MYVDSIRILLFFLVARIHREFTFTEQYLEFALFVSTSDTNDKWQ